MIVAGDPSGDQHASAVVRQLRQDMPQAMFWGIGGPAMEQAGFAPVMPFAPFNRMGLVEVLSHLPFFLGAKKKLVALMKERRPDVLLCVDYSGFNIPLMKAAHALGVPVVWYIAPMVWAWKRKRAAVLGAYAAHIATIFPFEAACFSPYRAPVSFVGNPTVEAMAAAHMFDAPRKTHPGKRPFHLAIVPGSRRQEIELVLPRMVRAAAILRQRFPGLRATVSRYGVLPEEYYRKVIGSEPVDLFSGPLQELLGRADCAFVKSGTATLEAALCGIPFVVAYRASAVSWALLSPMVKIPLVGLPNIIAGEEIVPECIQDMADPAVLAATISRFIETPALYDSTVGRLVALREKLAEKRPSIEVCRIIKEIITNYKLKL